MTVAGLPQPVPVWCLYKQQMGSLLSYFQNPPCKIALVYVVFTHKIYIRGRPLVQLCIRHALHAPLHLPAVWSADPRSPAEDEPLSCWEAWQSSADCPCQQWRSGSAKMTSQFNGNNPALIVASTTMTGMSDNSYTFVLFFFTFFPVFRQPIYYRYIYIYIIIYMIMPSIGRGRGWLDKLHTEHSWTVHVNCSYSMDPCLQNTCFKSSGIFYMF